MEELRVCADRSIRRWCIYGLLAIAAVMIGMAVDVELAIRDAALMAMLLWTFLCFKALRAPTDDYRKTEAWHLLDEKLEAVPPNRMQDIVGRTLQDRYLRHADFSACLAFLLWTVSFGLSVA